MIATVQLFLKGRLQPELVNLALLKRVSCVAFDECQEIANSGENKGSFQNEFLELGDKLRPYCCQCKSDNSYARVLHFALFPCY